jgi:hypothetical protein
VSTNSPRTARIDPTASTSRTKYVNFNPSAKRTTGEVLAPRGEHYRGLVAGGGAAPVRGTGRAGVS